MQRLGVLMALIGLGVATAFAGTAVYNPGAFRNSEVLGAQGPIMAIGTPGASLFSASVGAFYVYGDGQFKYALADATGAALQFDDTADYTIEWSQHVDPSAAIFAELGSVVTDSHYVYLGPGTGDGGVPGDPTFAESQKLTIGVELDKNDDFLPAGNEYQIKIHNHGATVFWPYTPIALDETQAHDIQFRVTYTAGSGAYTYEADTGAKAFTTVLDGATWGSFGAIYVNGGDFVVGRAVRSVSLAANGTFGTISVTGATVPALKGPFGLPSMTVPFFESK